MGDIYSHSFLNLAACAGPDSKSGLFPERDKLSWHNCAVKVRPGSQLPQGNYTIENGLSIRTELEESTLRTRGWVVQETFLAKRLLYFTPQQLFWECSTLCASEKCPGEMQTLARELQKKSSFDIPSIWEYPEDSPERDYEFYRVWKIFIGYYTGCELTK